MFKLRRRSGTVATTSDLPFCGMCGATMRVDASSGRCALGHRVTAAGTYVPPAEPVAAADPTQVLEAPSDETRPLIEPVDDYDTFGNDTVIGGGLYQAYSSADAPGGRAVTWDDVVAPSADTVTYDDYMTWDEPATGFSSLDVDTDELPVAADPADTDPYAGAYAEAEETSPAAGTTTPVTPDLLDELDDAAYARRKAVGTIGGTIAVTGAIFASIAVLPL